MLQQQFNQQVKFKGKNLISSEIATFIIFFFPPTAGILYIAGSVVYWPSLTNINPYTGGILFTVGSAMLVMVDIASSYIQPQFSLLRPLQNIGSFRAICIFIGNLSFTVGSVYFLPGLPVIIGDDLFILGSAFLLIPQILCVWGVCSLNIFTAPFYVKMIMFKKTLIWMNVCLAFGCFCFLIGTFLFKNQNIQTNALYEEAVILFILGSFFFFVGPLIALKMRKIRIFDPLSKYHHQMHSHYLPKSKIHLISFQAEIQRNSNNEFIVLPIEPSFNKQQV